jgi:hypothetical protein
VGTCVEVKVRNSEPGVAVKIESKEAHECNDDDDDHDDDFISRHGIIMTRPDGITGTWVISNVPYTVTLNTVLDEEHGALAVGTCVEVKVRASEPGVAVKIESEREYECTGRDDDGDDDAEGHLFGIIESLPPVLNNGIWVIGGISFTVSPTSTELVDKGEAFTAGVTVKVEFVTDNNDVNHAQKIEIKFGNGHGCREHDDGDDDNNAGAAHDDHGRFGNCPGHEGRAYGLIEIRPTDTLTGLWQIGRAEYLADEQTRFLATDDLRVGERVKIEYVVLSDGTRLATKIFETLDNGGLSDPNNSILVGFVISKPVAFVGQWDIDGVPFEADADTIFLERAGIFAVGSYVVVEYSITDDRRLIYKIQTHVPPGAGDVNTVGQLESIGGGQIAGALPTAGSSVWTVSGINFVVTEATQLVDNGGDLVAGAEVTVNSYESEGQQVATQIRVVGNKAFIPSAMR